MRHSHALALGVALFSISAQQLNAAENNCRQARAAVETEGAALFQLKSPGGFIAPRYQSFAEEAPACTLAGLPDEVLYIPETEALACAPVDCKANGA
ncbi:hypothetical protein [Nitratireductor indicus]|uniref:hypothetical protein n=1 Tax=Nitratireductor indicus TaxID=721133 RepID=UPI0028767EBA|nr:hypothetical protein [Nitratireductor indicus]MDS1134837.1 hypothetical protein [Nitratireductor indicus]